uniref:C-type lectin domain-containing protein n=1 Tax=Salmo trutta TaxID=8032 RepID=A0A674ACC6_SALTR
MRKLSGCGDRVRGFILTLLSVLTGGTDAVSSFPTLKLPLPNNWVDADSGVVNTTEEEVEGVDSQSPCPAGWHQNEHRCFSFYPVWATWATAEVTLTSKHTYQPVWIGGYDAAQEGMWLWSDGSAVDDVYWEEDEPSNSGQGENCMELHTGGGQGWNDVSCGELRFYVCSMETR